MPADEIETTKWLAVWLAGFTATYGWFIKRLAGKVENVEKIRLEMEHGYGPIYEKINDLSIAMEGVRVEMKHVCNDLRELKERDRQSRKTDKNG